METLIKTEVCNYSRSTGDNGDTRGVNQHTAQAADKWTDQLAINILL